VERDFHFLYYVSNIASHFNVKTSTRTKFSVSCDSQNLKRWLA